MIRQKTFLAYSLFVELDVVASDFLQETDYWCRFLLIFILYEKAHLIQVGFFLACFFSSEASLFLPRRFLSIVLTHLRHKSRQISRYLTARQYSFYLPPCLPLIRISLLFSASTKAWQQGNKATRPTRMLAGSRQKFDRTQKKRNGHLPAKHGFPL